METNSHLNRYMIILSDENADALEATTKSIVAVLRPISRRILPILPHLLLVQTAEQMDGVAGLLSDTIPQDGHWLIVPLGASYRGRVFRQRMIDLDSFFQD